MASYKEAVRWIADNDNDSEKDVENVDGTISVLLIADLFGKESRKVAEDVVAYRERPSCLICGHLMTPSGNGHRCPECKAFLNPAKRGPHAEK